MKSAKSGSDDNVAALSHTLIESDQISKDEQFAAWKASGLPISAIVHSGSKSIHAWVRVDAAHKAEYDERVKLVAAYLKGYEIDKTSDPSRYARMAGGMRPEGRQFLLATNIGAATFEEWETTLEYEDGSEDIAIDALLAFDRRNDEKSLAGQRWLAKGGQSVIQGPTGVGKSSLILQWAIRWAIGKGFFGIQPAKAMRVLIIQAENDLGDMAEAFQDTTDAILGFDEETKKISAELAEKKLEMVCHNLVMMRQDSKTGKAFVDFARRMVDKHRPDIVFADPLLAYVGDDILQQRVASEFLRNWMNPMIRETDLHWIWVHHISPEVRRMAGSNRLSRLSIVVSALPSCRTRVARLSRCLS